MYESLGVARQQSSGHVAPRNLPLAPVDRILAAIEEARRSRCGDLTLRDLVDEAPRSALPLASRQQTTSK